VNTWWRGGFLEILKGIVLRVIWGFFNMFRTLTNHTVYISLFLGILLLLFAAWLTSTSNSEQTKCIEPLIGADKFIDQVVNGLNDMTQEYPIEAIDWLNGVINKVEDLTNNMISNIQYNSIAAINTLASGTQDAINDANQWAASQGGQSVSTVKIPHLSLPTEVLPVSWRTPVPESEIANALLALKIPSRSFSIQAELTPFVEKIFDFPRTIADYCNIIGAVLVAYAAFRLLFALIQPFVPLSKSVDGTPADYCLRFGKACVLGWSHFFSKLTRPWINLPLLIGIIIICLTVIWLIPGIIILKNDIKKPLHNIDNALGLLRNDINNYTEKVPTTVNNYVRKWQDIINNDVFTAFYNVMNQKVLYNLNQDIGQIQTPINQVLSQMGAGTIQFPVLDLATLGVTTPNNWMPYIPPLNASDLQIPSGLFSVENSVGPWVDERMNDVDKILWRFLIVGIILVAIPGASLLCSLLYPFLPRRIDDFFLHPGFWDLDEQKQQQEELETPNA